MQQIPYRHYTVEPSPNFTSNVMSQLALVEEQRRKRLNMLFGMVALTPLVLRWSWFLIRRDFVAVNELPFSTTITQIYSVFLSPTTAYVLAIGGIFVAIMIVGLPQWRTARS